MIIIVYNIRVINKRKGIFKMSAILSYLAANLLGFLIVGMIFGMVIGAFYMIIKAIKALFEIF